MLPLIEHLVMDRDLAGSFTYLDLGLGVAALRLLAWAVSLTRP